MLRGQSIFIQALLIIQRSGIRYLAVITLKIYNTKSDIQRKSTGMVVKAAHQMTVTHLRKCGVLMQLSHKGRKQGPYPAISL